MPVDREQARLSNPRRSPAASPHDKSQPDLTPDSESSLAHETAEIVALNASFEPGVNGPRLAPLPAIEPVRLPPVSDVRCMNTTRLLPAKYSESVLTRIADNDEDLQLIFALDNATNDRLQAEGNLRLGITARELVFEVPYCRIVNAAFTHPHPLGARFSMPYRGAWYAGLELATAKAEVLFHRAVQFAEIGWQQPEELDYDQYTADFTGCFHDLRPPAVARADPEPPLQVASGANCDQPAGGAEKAGGFPPAVSANRKGERRGTLQLQAAALPSAAVEFAACLALDSYVASQQLAIHLLEAGSLGILYPSARRPGGNCIACFRPSLVGNVRKRNLYRMRWYPDQTATFVHIPRLLPSTEEL